MSVPSTFSALAFAEPARARANVERLQERLPERVLSLLPVILAQVPDADGALNNLERFTREASRGVTDAFARQPVLLHYLLALFSHSRFLSETLIQEPQLLLWLGRERHLTRIKSKEDLLEDYARFQTTAGEEDPALSLARFKRREYLRITLKDILRMAELGEITLELSLLADVLLEKALSIAHREQEGRYGAPAATDARGRVIPARFAVVSLGKLGGNELNYSSDIDLLFLYGGPGETGAVDPSHRIANREFFLRLAQRLLQLITGITLQGPVYRVDMRLRPGGGEGDLAISLPAALLYYEQQAREWELQMLLKARPSAGDPGLVRDFLAGVEPFLYRGEMHFAAVESVLRAREEFDKKLDAAAPGRLNVKLAPGGLRDIEFLVQCLQRLYGRVDRWVRAPGTLVGLQKLYDKGYLTARDHFRLAAAYQFLRRVEHRLQLDQGQQIHTLPRAQAALELLARRCELRDTPERSAREEFLRQLDQHLRHVRELYKRILPRAARLDEPHEFSLQPPEALVLPGKMSFGELLENLRARNPSLGEAIEKLEVPPRARRSLHDFLAAAFSSSQTFEQVSRAAAALPLGVELLRLSEPLGALLTRRPERLAELLPLRQANPGMAQRQLAIRLPVAAGPATFGGFRALAEQPGPLAERMAELRNVFRDAVFRWGAREICAPRPVEAGLREYTGFAEEILRASLTIAERHCDPPFRGLAVVGLGRLGTAVMDLGSDVDLLFVVESQEQTLPARAVAEKLIHIVSGYTREGTLFPIDIRLRPQGSEGELVQTIDAVLDYMADKADVWEAATYLKARPVAGDLALGAELCRKVREVLAPRFQDPDRVCKGLREMRRRQEEETQAGADNFKSGPGGVYDLDFLFSAEALLRGAESMAGHGLVEQARRWVPAALQSHRPTLVEAAVLLRTVEHAVRLATGQPVPQLPAGPRVEAVGELVSRWRGETLAPATLVDLLTETRHQVRALFEAAFG